MAAAVAVVITAAAGRFPATAIAAPGAGAAATAEPGFDADWHDGRAELDGYRWSGTRYGEPRTGTSVMIFVTEPFSKSQRVKLDDPSRDPHDAVDVLKLNVVRDFQTGIYDYNTMLSVFARSADFAPLKVSFTSAEWCGQVYDELEFDDREVHQQRFSYFEGASAQRSFARPADALIEDNLFIRLRGLRGAFLAPGERRTVRLLPGTLQARLTHQQTEWGRAEVERLDADREIEVPAGVFETQVYVVTTGDGRRGTFHVEAARPHRIVRWRWETSGGGEGGGTRIEQGELTGTARLQYWKLNGNGGERYLQQLGIGG